MVVLINCGRTIYSADLEDPIKTGSKQLYLRDFRILTLFLDYLENHGYYNGVSEIMVLGGSAGGLAVFH